MKRLRVCHLGKYYPPAPGGIETHVRTLAQAQAGLGAEVAVFCFQHEASPTARERDGAVEVSRFQRVASLAKLDLSAELCRALARVRADVIHMQAPNPAGVVAVLTARPRVPLVVTYQSDVVRQRLLAILFRPLERLFYRRVHLILSTSPVYSAGSRFLAAYRSRLSVLPMGIDLEPYLNPAPAHQDAARRLRERYAGPLWLACGRLVYYKGLSIAIQALRKTPGTLLIVGDGPEQAALEAETQRQGVSDRVVFIGRVALPGNRSLLPGGRGVLVSVERPLGGVRIGPGRGDGVRLSGNQHEPVRQRRALGEPGKRDGLDGSRE